MMPNSSVWKASVSGDLRLKNTKHTKWNPVLLGETCNSVLWPEIIGWLQSKSLQLTLTQRFDQRWLLWCYGAESSSIASNVNMCTSRWQEEQPWYLGGSFRVHMHTCHILRRWVPLIGGHRDWTGFLCLLLWTLASLDVFILFPSN